TTPRRGSPRPSSPTTCWVRRGTKSSRCCLSARRVARGSALHEPTLRRGHERPLAASDDLMPLGAQPPLLLRQSARILGVELAGALQGAPVGRHAPAPLGLVFAGRAGGD